MNKINRRSLLSWLGAIGASTLAPLSAAADARRPERTRILSIESFLVTRPDQMQRLHAYLGGTFLPLANEIHGGPKVFLEAIVAPQTPQALCLTVFSSFDEMLDVRGKLAAHPRVRQARAGLDCMDAPVLEKVQSQVMITTHEPLRPPVGSKRLETGVFELRSYQAPAWQDGPPARVSAVLARAGIHPLVHAATAAGEHLPRLTDLIPFESLAARQEAWDKLAADSEWIALQQDAMAKHGSAVKVTEKSIYKLAPYSQWA